jgi:hypothetical protein
MLSRLAGRREIADTTISIPHPYSEQQARQWIAGLLRRSAICQPYKHIQKSGMITAKVAAETHPPYARVECRYDHYKVMVKTSATIGQIPKSTSQKRRPPCSENEMHPGTDTHQNTMAAMTTFAYKRMPTLMFLSEGIAAQ